MLVGEEYFKVVVLLLAEATDVDVWTNLHHHRMSHCVIRGEGETVTLFIQTERRAKQDNTVILLKQTGERE